MTEENTDKSIINEDSSEESNNTESEKTLITDDTPKSDDVKSESDEGKKDEDQGTEDGKDGKADKPEGAPEKYEDFKFPEALEVDPEAMEAAQTIFKELNLTQDQAQQLVDFESKIKTDEVDRQVTAWNDLQDTWKKESLNDKEFGGTEADANMAIAKTGRDAFGSDEFKTMLDVTGVGNHPEMIRFLWKLGKAVSDDKILQGSNQKGEAKTAAQVMFPDMN